MPVQDGQFIVDRYGRRLLDDQGRFMVHDSTAMPCCGGCPWGISLQGPDHPGGYVGTLYGERIHLRDFWHWPTVAGLKMYDPCYIHYSGIIGPTTGILYGQRTNGLWDEYFVALRGAPYIDTFCGLNPLPPPYIPPSYNRIAAVNTPDYSINIPTAMILPEPIGTREYFLEPYTMYRNPCVGTNEVPSPANGLSLVMTSCVWGSDLPEGITEWGRSPIIYPGVGQRYTGGYYEYQICQGYPGAIGNTQSTCRAWYWPIYKYNFPGGVIHKRFRITAHGSWLPTNDDFNGDAGYGVWLMQYAISRSYYLAGYVELTPPRLGIQTSCDDAEWYNTADVDVYFPIPQFVPSGHFLIIELAYHPYFYSPPTWCVIDTIEVIDL